MSYKFLEAFDTFQFFQDVKAAHGISDFKFIASGGSVTQPVAYFGVRDLVQLSMASTPNLRALAFNPITREISPGVDSYSNTIGASDVGPYANDCSDPAQPNLTFSWGGITASDEVRPWDVNTQSRGGALPANWVATCRAVRGTNLGTVAGGYGSSSNIEASNWLIFRGLTNGIPGGVWTPGNRVGGTDQVGANVYPGGLGLMRSGSQRLLSNQIVNDAFVWVNLALGTVVGVAFPNLPGLVTTIAGDFNEGPVFGNIFDWCAAQFIPDPDSTSAGPKGEVMFWSETEAGSTIVIPGGAPRAIFLRFVDFNPLNLSPTGGAPTRVHGRISETNAIEMTENPVFGLAGFGTMQNAANDRKPFFHPASRRIFMFASDTSAGLTNVALDSAMAFWVKQPNPVGVTAPVARDVPRTADIVEFEAFVFDNLSTPIGGQQVAWSLFRNSTEDELLTITGGGGTTSTVVNEPIDTTPAGAAILSITADGVPLVLTTDYTVVAATGVITWVTSQVGKVVRATYEHRTVNATPAHGTLLSALSQSASDGRVFTQVRYPDDDALAGRLDRLISALA